MPNHIPVPPIKQLEQAYLKEGLSAVALGEKFGVSDTTAKKWLKLCGITIRSQAEQAEVDKAKHQKQIEAAITPEPVVVEAELVPVEAEQREAVVSGGLILPDNSLNALPSVGLNEDEDDGSPWSQLSRTQIAAIELLSSFAPEDIDLTDEQRALQLGIHVNTLKNWRKDEIFRECLDQARKSEFVDTLKEESRKDLIKRFQEGRTTKEERINAFKLTGDGGPDTVINNNTMNVYKDNLRRF